MEKCQENRESAVGMSPDRVADFSYGLVLCGASMKYTFCKKVVGGYYGIYRTSQ